MVIKIGKEKAAKAMEFNINPDRIDPIVHPIERSDNPYINSMKRNGIFQNAAKSFLNRSQNS